MYLIACFCPFISFLLISLYGRKLGYMGTTVLSTLCLLCSSFFALLSFYYVVLNSSTTLISLNEWFQVASLKNEWSFIFDPLSTTMIFVVSFISMLVHIYSASYMKEDHIIVVLFLI